jgi:uncharacterized membrane protein
MHRRSWLLLVPGVLALALSLALYSHLPDRIPIHWGIHGQANGWGSRATGAFALPALMLALGLFFGVLSRYLPDLLVRYQPDERPASLDQGAYTTVLGLVLLLLLAVHVYALASALGWLSPAHQPRAMALILAVGFILIGNYLPRVTRRNAFIGARFPWAYASEEVWRRTQRVSGYGMVAVGVLGLGAALVAPARATLAMLVLLLVYAAVVAVYSYWLTQSARGG